MNHCNAKLIAKASRILEGFYPSKGRGLKRSWYERLKARWRGSPATKRAELRRELRGIVNAKTAETWAQAAAMKHRPMRAGVNYNIDGLGRATISKKQQAMP